MSFYNCGVERLRSLWYLVRVTLDSAKKNGPRISSSDIATKTLGPLLSR